MIARLATMAILLLGTVVTAITYGVHDASAQIRHAVDIVPGATFKTTDAYSPNPIEIAEGDSVLWTNKDSTLHTVTSGAPYSGPTGEFGGTEDNPVLISPGSAFEHTFGTAGTFDYYCMLHPQMTGQVIVISAPDDSSKTPYVNAYLEISPGPPVVAGEPSTLKVTFRTSDYEVQPHIDYNIKIIVEDEKKILFDAAEEVGQPALHTAEGVVTIPYTFADPRQYTVLIIVTGILFVPVEPQESDWVVVVEENQSTTISITTDKSSYASGDVVYYSGQVNPVNPAYQVKVEMFYPSGSLANSFADYAKPDGTFEGGMYVEGSSGTYKLVATYGDSSASTPFTLTSTSNVIAPTTPPLTIATDKSSYLIGETLTYYGTATLVGSYTTYTIEIRDDRGVVIFDTTGELNADGSYESSIYLGPEYPTDDYTIRIYYGGNLRISEEFSIDRPTITLSTDKSSYLEGETLTYYGTATLVGSYTTYTVEIRERNTVYFSKTGTLNADGSYESSIELGPELEPDDYTIRILYGGMVTNAEFSIEKPTITLATDKQSYTTDETLHYSGTVNPVPPSMDIRMDLRDQDGFTVFGKTIQPNSKGLFFSDIVLGNEPGTYDLTAYYGEAKSTVTFTISADGTESQTSEGKIVFQSLGSLYIMNPDGSEVSQLTDPGAGGDNSPFFSPNGTKILYSHWGYHPVDGSGSDFIGRSTHHIYSINPDGSEESQLTTTPNVIYNTPSISLDDKIVFLHVGTFVDDNDGGSDILEGDGIIIMNPDGTEKKSLTGDNPVFGDPKSRIGTPSISPDGTKIVFAMETWVIDGVRDDYPYTEFGHWDQSIYIMNSDGGDLKKLPTNFDKPNRLIAFSSPSISPDGTKIVFSGGWCDGSEYGCDGDDPGAAGTFIMDLTGAEMVQLTDYRDKDYSDFDPSWSPDGSKIVFASTRDGNTEIYVMNKNGSDQTRLTYNDYTDDRPSWGAPSADVAEKGESETLTGGFIKPIVPSKTVSSIEVIMDKSAYEAGDISTVTVKMSGELISGQNIALSIADPSGSNIISRTLTTDSAGAASLEFKIAENYAVGTYTVTATSSFDGDSQESTTQFKVSPHYAASIISVQATDQQGNPVSSFEKGSLGSLKVVVSSESRQSALLTVNTFDSELTSISVGSVKSTLDGTSEIVISFLVPQDAASGESEVFANLFTDWPSLGGAPLASEVSTKVQIA